MCAHVCSVASSYDMLTDGSTKPQDAGWGMGNGGQENQLQLAAGEAQPPPTHPLAMSINGVGRAHDLNE